MKRVLLFFLPLGLLGLFGLWILAGGVEGVLAGREADWPVLLIGLILLIGAALGSWSLMWASGELAEEEQLKSQFPSEPWKWRRDWLSGRIPCTTRNQALGLCFIGLFLILVSLFFVTLVSDEDWELVRSGADYRPLLVVSFGVVGLVFLLIGLRKTWNWRRFGNSVLVLSGSPGVIGGPFSAIVETRLPRPPAQAARLTLSCLRRTTTVHRRGTRSETRIHVHTEWSTDWEVSPREFQPGPRGWNLPASVIIPYGLAPTDSSRPEETIFWQLAVSAAYPGADFEAQWQVPVFVTAESRPETREERKQRVEEARVEAEPSSHKSVFEAVQRTPVPGGMSYRLRPDYSIRQYFKAGFWTVVLVAATLVALWMQWPWGIALAFGILALIFVAAMVAVLGIVATVNIVEGKVSVRKKLLGFGWTSLPETEFNQIKKIVAGRISDAGGPRGSTRNAAWELQFHLEDGLEIAAGTFTNLATAKALAREVEKLVD